MGTLEVLTATRKGIEGSRIGFRVETTTSDLLHSDRGTYDCGITVQTGDSEKRIYGGQILVADWSDRWFDRFMDTFAANITWREQWRITERTPPPSPTRPVILQGQEVAIDGDIAEAIVALNAVGAITRFSCQGTKEAWSCYPQPRSDTHSLYGYIILAEGTFPDDLLQAMRAAGFRVQPDSIYADSPLRDAAQANGIFVRILQDWVAHRLDPTGHAYQISPATGSSLPPLPAAPVPPGQVDRQIQHLIRLGSKARFQDFLAVRSGTDQYSRMSYTQLVARVEPGIPQIVAQKMPEQPEAVQARVYRWYLRGLPVELAIRKVEIDLEVAANVTKSRNAR